MLRLGGNSLRKIGQEVYNLKKLTELEIQANDFTELPAAGLASLAKNLFKLRLDWFKYAQPAITEEVQQHNG